MKNLIFKCNWNFDPERDKYLLDVHKGTSIQISILVGDDA